MPFDASANFICINWIFGNSFWKRSGMFEPERPVSSPEVAYVIPLLMHPMLACWLRHSRKPRPHSLSKFKPLHTHTHTNTLTHTLLGSWVSINVSAYHLPWSSSRLAERAKFHWWPSSSFPPLAKGWNLWCVRGHSLSHRSGYNEL